MLIRIEIKTSPVLSPVWYIGDRVQRRANIWDSNSPVFRRGKIVLRYSTMISLYDNRVGDPRKGDYPEVYAVLWDSGVCEKGLLPHGLEREVR